MTTTRVDYEDLLTYTTQVFEVLGIPPARAREAATALCHGDLTGVTSHGLFNLTRLYVKLFADGRVNPDAELKVEADRGAALLIDADRALGLWAASEAMSIAADRAANYGVGLVSVRNSTHLGCVGYHASRAVESQMIGLIASNCGRQRIIRPPGGAVTMLGTNPFSLAAPSGQEHPFVLDMSTTVAPTGRIRTAAKEGRPIPAGWLENEDGETVTDPAAFDRGDAHLLWLGSRPETGAFKGYGLGLLVEILGSLLPGAGMGPEPEALSGDGGPSGRDDDIGFLALAIAPSTLRPGAEFAADAATLFGTLLDCPPAGKAGAAGAARKISYPGWPEAELARRNRAAGVPLTESLYAELCDLAGQLGIEPPTGVK